MSQQQSDLEVITKAMELTGSQTIGELVTAFADHGVRNATELVAKLEGSVSS